MSTQEKMDKETLREERRRLHQIYLDHDVEAFRGFIKDRAERFPELIPFIDESTKILNSLMYNMKSQLMYLPDWQDSRNFVRYERDWANSGKAVEDIPKCLTCKFFREGPSGELPCIQLGGIPSDIACLAYEKALETGIS
jgi:hypothetical protein